MQNFSSHGLTVKNIDLSSKCWVVRPGVRYRFINEFIEDGFIATAHLDDVELTQDDIDELRYAEGEHIYTLCTKFNPELSNNTRAQVISFIKEMSEGDVVFTLSGGFVYPGIVKSAPYLEMLPLSKDENFQVRRKVAWGDRIERDKIPVTLSKSFTAYQAVFSLGGNSKEIHHWLNSFFISDERFCASLRVEQRAALSHHALKNLSEIMDRVEVLSRLIGGEESFELFNTAAPYRSDVLKKAMAEFACQGILSLKQQQLTMSPGDIWYELPTRCKRTGVIFMVTMAMLFSQSVAFADPALAEISREVSPIVQRSLEEIKEGVDFQSVQRELWLNVPAQNEEFVKQDLNVSDDFPDDESSPYSVN